MGRWIGKGNNVRKDSEKKEEEKASSGGQLSVLCSGAMDSDIRTDGGGKQFPSVGAVAG